MEETFNSKVIQVKIIMAINHMLMIYKLKMAAVSGPEFVSGLSHRKEHTIII